MKHFLKLVIIFVIASATLFYSFVSNSISQNKIQIKNQESSGKNRSENYDGFLQDILNRVKKDYVEEKTDKQLFEAAASGLLSSLDPHSSYLNDDELKEMHVQTKGEFGGVGIEITLEYSLVKVVAAIDGTPAQKAGVKSGDYISKVDGKSIAGNSIEEVVKKLRGKAGTKVAITILRKGEKEPIEISLIRQNIQVKAVKSSRKKDIAYIKINSFSEQAYSGMTSEIRKLVDGIGKNKIRGLVLDLRNNPGGLLDQAVKVSDVFLDKGLTIVSIRGRNKEGNIYKDESDQNLIAGVPIVVLINEGSASASEIVAGALQDNKRAVIVGTKSFGKGSVQTVIPLENKRGALKMTTALYYTPSGKSIQAHGIEPDIIVNEAKLELKKVNNNDEKSEANLNGHLKNQIEEAVKEANKDKLEEDNMELYNEDYQLARAVDLLRGISVYKKIGN
jgi:carboxyl-terminal processing protease